MARAILIGVIRFYRRAVSPFTPPACRFHPTCSAYALEAVERHGAVRGGWLALRRLLRCHPFGGSGWDPVPRVRGREEVGGRETAGDGRTERRAMEADPRGDASRPRVERRWTGDR